MLLTAQPDVSGSFPSPLSHYLLFFSLSDLLAAAEASLGVSVCLFTDADGLPGMTQKYVSAVGLSSVKGNRKGPLRDRWWEGWRRQGCSCLRQRKNTDNWLEEFCFALITLGLSENLKPDLNQTGCEVVPARQHTFWVVWSVT